MNPRATSAQLGGFSLLELIGALAVISIMATVLAPPLLDQIERLMEEHEREELRVLADGLKASIRRTKHIPDQTGWVQAVSAEVGWAESDVLANDWRSERVYLIDPEFRVGPVDGLLPHDQTTAGSIKPESPRILILSSLDPTKPIPVDDGVPAAGVFDAIWETQEGTAPPGWGGRWIDGGDDLKIQRIHLGALFHQVILNSTNIPMGSYAIDEGSPVSVPGGGVSAYFIDGTVLGLFDGGNTLETREIIDRPASFSYESGGWNGRIFRGAEPADDSIYLASELFVKSAAHGGAAPVDLKNAMTLFFIRYVAWDGADFSGGGTQPYIELQTALSDVETAADASSPPD